jgi:hypothetical protein
MNVTRILEADQSDALRPIAKVIGGMRADIWHRFGGVAGSQRPLSEIRKAIPKLFGGLQVDGTIRAETAKDVLNDIKTYREAAKAKVRKAIHRRADGDQDEAKRLYTLLRKDEWTRDNFLHRQMRKHFRHGQARNRNQFIVRSDRHSEEVVDGRLVITIRVASKYGEDVRLVTTSNGDGVNLTGKNLRIMLRDGHTEIHYAYDKGEGRPCGTETVGVDKGYTEALVDSDGHFHGRQFGTILRDYTDQVTATGKARGKLRAIEENHREAGRVAKADRIKRNNLGIKKLDRRRKRTEGRLRTEAFKAAHAVVDKASTVGSEDLTSRFNRKKSWGRGFNRRMGMWAKGVLAEALASVTQQRSAGHVLVNAAYTSQVSSQTGRLEGERQGDRFIAVDGKVVHADVNAARNIRDRINDPEIGRYMPFDQVKQVLLRRSSGGVLSLNRPELGADTVRQPGADKILCLEIGRF